MLESNKSAKYLVHRDFYFVSSIWDKNNRRYSGIHQLNDLGQIILKTGINLENFEWINVMKRANEINDTLHGNISSRDKKRSANEVQVWSYRLFLNGEEVKDQTATIKYYTKDEAKRQMMKPSLKLKPEDVLENELISDYIEQPSELLIMRMVLQHIAKVCVDINCHMNCAVCQENPFPELKKT